MDLLIAVLGANLLTVMCVFGVIQVSKKEEGSQFSWAEWLMVAFPIVMVILGLLQMNGAMVAFDAWAGY